ncbi:hypothetical protein RIF29_28454 [Crotalaria pallida]|uniref:Uncharacterized protein n=1 Tax=Crotalaria pallida TaxID=3830 RepID=A0AAN9HV23_CROPI
MAVLKASFKKAEAIAHGFPPSHLIEIYKRRTDRDDIDSGYVIEESTRECFEYLRQKRIAGGKETSQAVGAYRPVHSVFGVVVGVSGDGVGLDFFEDVVRLHASTARVVEVLADLVQVLLRGTELAGDDCATEDDDGEKRQRKVKALTPLI